MAYVLTEASSITCAKSGKVQVSATARLKVDGKVVLTLASIDKMPISNCGASSKPCTAVSGATGAASKLRVDGQGVALATLIGTTDGEDATLAPAVAGQTRLQGE